MSDIWQQMCQTERLAINCNKFALRYEYLNDEGPSMTEKTKEIIELALQLDITERQELVAELVASIEDESSMQLHPDWSQEILRRLEELDSQKVKTVPWSQVRQQLVTKLRSAK